MLFDKASLYVGAALSNVCLSHDSALIRLFTAFGSSRIIGGGWLDKRLMYRGSLFGFL